MSTFLAAMMVLAAIGIVSWPLLRGIGAKSRPGLVEDTEVSDLLAQKDATLFAISELESDYEIGSLSQADYQELRQKYEEKAVALIKAVDEMRSERGLQGVNHIDEEIESRVSKLRRAKRGAPAGKSCPGCGAQIEVDDQFCSRCGAVLSTAGKRGKIT